MTMTAGVRNVMNLSDISAASGETRRLGHEEQKENVICIEKVSSICQPSALTESKGLSGQIILSLSNGKT